MRLFNRLKHQEIIYFLDRFEGGEKLAEKLKILKDERPIVLALPRGGVPVAERVAKLLAAPLSVLVSRKIGHPMNPEFGIGAIAENETVVLNQPAMAAMGIDLQEVDKVIKSETSELNRRLGLYLDAAGRPELKNRTVIVVDDGLATGMTARASVEAVKKYKPKRIIFSAPVCAKQSVAALESQVDKVICVIEPVKLRAVGQFYRDFEPVSDEEVFKILKQAKTNSAQI